MTDCAPIRGAVSSLSGALVHGPVRPATVVAVTRLGIYLLLEGEGPTGVAEVLPVVTADALMLPTALRLPFGSTDVGLRFERLQVEEWPVEHGQAALVGGGAVVAPSLRVEAVRTVRPARVRRARMGRPTARGPLGRAPHTVASDLLGRLGHGPGLTPEADDELAGHLLVMWALGPPALPDLERDLEPHLHRTTALSASLLRAAAQGFAVPEVVAYVDAVVASDRDAALALQPRVEAIGHTSGPALLRGIHALLPPVTPHPSVERTVA